MKEGWSCEGVSIPKSSGGRRGKQARGTMGRSEKNEFFGYFFKRDEASMNEEKKGNKIDDGKRKVAAAHGIKTPECQCYLPMLMRMGKGVFLTLNP